MIKCLCTGSRKGMRHYTCIEICLTEKLWNNIAIAQLAVVKKQGGASDYASVRLPTEADIVFAYAGL